jgi:Zn-finger nucleic acid-binding protein
MIKCPDCGFEIDASGRITGDQVVCPNCDGVFTVRFKPIIIIKEPEDAE